MLGFEMIFQNNYVEVKRQIPKPDHKLSEAIMDCVMNKVHTEKWRSMLKEDSRTALKYFFDNLLSHVVQNFLEKQSVSKDVDTLISLMGYSPETTVLTAAVLKPRKLVVVSGEATSDNYDMAANFMMKNNIIKPHQIIFEKIDVKNSRSIYESVFRHGVGVSSIVIDITGGKKVMSAAAAQAAWDLDCELCYIDGMYDPDLRRPVPGTEFLITLENPSLEKAIRVRQRAFDAWKLRQFATARKLFEDSRNLNAEHNIEDVFIHLCNLYDALFNFNMRAFYEHFTALRTIQERAYVADIYEKLGVGRMIGAIKEDPELKSAKNRIAVFLFLAEEYAGLQRYDFASLLSYRAIENALNEGLSIAAGKEFNTAKPDYSQLPIDEKSLLIQFCNFKKSLGGRVDSAEILPEKIALIDALILIFLIKPEILGVDLSTKNMQHLVHEMMSIGSIRNLSILAHGYTSLAYDDYIKIYSKAEHIAERVCGKRVLEKKDVFAFPVRSEFFSK
jgi:hypothetical protein